MAIQGGFGVLLKIDVSGLTTTANLLDTDFPEQSKMLEEATGHSATGGYAVYVASGKRELGEFTATLLWDKADSTHAKVLTVLAANATVNMSIQDPAGAEIIAFAAHVKSVKRISKQDEAYKAEITFQPSANPTITP
jgi:hypothetical protein